MVVWWCGGVVVWWCGGVVVWWCGGVEWWGGGVGWAGLGWLCGVVVRCGGLRRACAAVVRRYAPSPR